MKWTHEKPAKPGRYLLAHARGYIGTKDGFGLQIVERRDCLMTTPHAKLLDTDGSTKVECIDGSHWWLGPIADVPSPDSTPEVPDDADE